MKKILAVLTLFLIFQIGFSQSGILESSNKKGNFQATSDLIIKSLDVKAQVFGNMSSTTVTMVIKNQSDRILEGRVTFPLPEGVTISSYALDINGKLRNAVPVPKERGKEVFESIEKRNVDPGLIEKVEGNNFRTRIYPILPNKERIVQMTYHMNLKSNNQQTYYDFTFDHQKKINAFSLALTVYDQLNKPSFVEKPDGSLDFVKHGNAWTSDYKATNFITKNNLRININQKPAQQVISQKAIGNQYYFQLNYPVVKRSQKRDLPKKLGLIWDVSLSSKQKDLQKELQLLTQYFKANNNVEVQLALLDNTFRIGKSYKIKNGDFSELKNDLSKTNYDGGSDFSKITPLNVDAYLMFSDGISSFGDFKVNLSKPVFTITSNSKSNFNTLKYLSQKTGGVFINLVNNSVDNAVDKLLVSEMQFLGIKDNTSVNEVYPKLPTILDDMLVINGIANQPNTNLTLLFGFNGKVTEEKIVALDFVNNLSQDWDVSRFWAQQKINDLVLMDNSKKEIKEIAEQFGIVTDNTSLIVLENLSDYIKHKITPPEDLLADYQKHQKTQRLQLLENRKNIMSRAEATALDLKNWWNTDFNQNIKYPKPIKNRDSASTANIEEVVVAGYGTVASNTRRTNRLQGRIAGVSINNFSPEAKKVPDIINAKITTNKIKSTEVYMSHFEGLKSTDKIYEAYLKYRADYQVMPSYYFDVANLLFDLNDDKLALRVLSSIADLDLENEELYKLLMYQLKKYNQSEKTVWIAKKILDWRPMDPQSYRDYALALEDNKQYDEALKQLYRIFEIDYDETIAVRDYKIEETVLLELNQLINNRKADAKNINKKLLIDIPVNIRVVLNWNRDNTDIDLWVTDPNDEKSMYSNKKTSTGGRLSDDFTGGFGPEQFIMKKAIKGKYKIETNFYGENQAHIAGPTALMAEVFLNYASGKQERKIVVFQSKLKDVGGNNNGILIAEFDY